MTVLPSTGSGYLETKQRNTNLSNFAKNFAFLTRLDYISEGSVILTFLLPTCVSLAGLNNNPEIVLLSSNGIIILCGPPGITNAKWQNCLLTEDPMTYEKAHKLLLSLEAAEKGMKDIAGEKIIHHAETLGRR